jgi:predicted RNA-binding Zn ribbon-like protein
MIPASHQFRIHKFGAAAPWVDLANSEMWDGYGRLTDFLNDPQWISDFLEFWRFRVPLPGPAVLRDLRRLRKLLRQFAEKTSQGVAIQPRDLEALNSWLKVPVFRRLVENQNGLQLTYEPVQIGWPAALARIADSLAEALAHDSPDRLKICANTGCTWVFVDRTKGRVRRWCSDATCGNRDRVRRSRAAHKG